ncbi:TonB-dependent receptor [Aliiglaciecola lipolytica]|uniref:TonB-dependent receptor n=1 Tax=Aliiglaciecola lipolytica E3 TaxID=1127673 RepID=K6XS48_9ALTE|nr:TonB-dependent receptor [Aliiglaciecola lipolytica]GAC14506.1 TonB-dependent receptor [Aliiglaciecola lipolytica E3]
MKRVFIKTQLSTIIGLYLSSSLVYAQTTEQDTDEDLGLEVIEVTAQKRVQNLQELPIAVSVFNSEAIREQGISDVEDLSLFAPNVQISETPAGSTGATIAIRGSVTINPAITWEPTTGVYIDGVFVSKNVGGLFDVAAIDRVEILRGPQGTLYGKNTIGGAINIITRKPAGELGGEVRVGAGNYGLSDFYVSADSALINDSLSLNFTANKRDRDGFYDNLSANSPITKFKELDSLSMRFAALYEHSETLNFYYVYDSSDKDLTPPLGQVNIPSLMPDDVKSRQESAALDGVDFDRSKSTGHALTVTWDAGKDLQVKSISALRDIDYADTVDADGADLIGFHTVRRVKHEQFTQEVQFIGSTGEINYVGGLFYMTEESDADNPFTLGFGTLNNFYGVETESMAAFAHADYDINEKLRLTAGLRWTTEEKTLYIERPDDFSFAFFFPLARTTANDTWNNTTAMISLNYELADNIQTYGKISQGWKAGGFNGEAPNAELAIKPYDAEEVLAYEWGLKSRWLDQRLQANIAVFYNDVTDMQMSEFLGAYSDIQNAGSANISGLEVEIVAAISQNLSANFNYGLLNTDYDEFITFDVVTGLPNEVTNTAEFPYSPEKKWSIGLNYQAEISVGQLIVSADYSYVDDHFPYHNQPSADFTRIASYSIFNARITLSEIAGSNFDLAVWGKNILDEEYRINGLPVADATGTFIGGLNYYGNPATFGVELSYRF